MHAKAPSALCTAAPNLLIHPTLGPASPEPAAVLTMCRCRSAESQSETFRAPVRKKKIPSRTRRAVKAAAMAGRAGPGAERGGAARPHPRPSPVSSLARPRFQPGPAPLQSLPASARLSPSPARSPRVLPGQGVLKWAASPPRL